MIEHSPLEDLDTGEGLDWGIASMPDLTPFFRWVGSKARICSQVVEAIGQVKGRYVDPTLGAGAVPLRLVSKGLVRPEQLHLSDLNSHLVAAWQAVLTDPEGLGEAVAKIQSFQEAKQSAPATELERAARFLYLQARSFNGLWRVNRQGQYNVAQDLGKKGPPLRSEAIRKCHAHLKGAKVAVRDMFEVIPNTVKGDTLYVDPPYLANFSGYSKEEFGLEAHTILTQQLNDAVARGVTVLTSNADSPEVRQLYQGWKVIEIEARRSVSCTADQRGAVTELLLVGAHS